MSHNDAGFTLLGTAIGTVTGIVKANVFVGLAQSHYADVVFCAAIGAATGYIVKAIGDWIIKGKNPFQRFKK